MHHSQKSLVIRFSSGDTVPPNLLIYVIADVAIVHLQWDLNASSFLEEALERQECCVGIDGLLFFSTYYYILKFCTYCSFYLTFSPTSIFYDILT